MKKHNKIIIAVPRGRILSELRIFFKKIKLNPDKSLFDESCRKLLANPNTETYKFELVEE